MSNQVEAERASLSLKIIIGGCVAATFLVLNSLKVIPPLPEWLSHLLMTIAVVTVVHLFDHYFLIRETRQSLDIVTSRLLATQEEAMRVLERQSISLQTMDRCDVENIYESRSKASEVIMRSLTNPGNQEIRLMGISLNDFVRDTEQNPLREAWSWIARTIKNPSASGASLKRVRVLLIDPYSNGAMLRSFSETKDVEATPFRLRTDVLEAARYLSQLERTVNVPGKEKVLETRLYRIAPIAFLCHLDSTCYIQQYYYWSQRGKGMPMPVLEFKRPPTFASRDSLHQEMVTHFDFVFDYASVPVADVVGDHNVGFELGAGYAGLTNILPNSSEGSERMATAIRAATKRVWLQGVSCRSFFSAGSLSTEMHQKLGNSSIEARILLIDTDSNQAVFRSYREWLLNSDENLSLDEFRSREHAKRKLVTDTKASIETLRAWIRGFKNTKGNDWQPSVQLRDYQTSPYCFMLLCDDTLFVEPYNDGYGEVETSRKDGADDRILGSEMPLFEFHNAVPAVYASAETVANRALPFKLLLDHFKFAFDAARKIDLAPPRTTSASTSSSS